jgi:CheY-like chemotaxis protein
MPTSWKVKEMLSKINVIAPSSKVFSTTEVELVKQPLVPPAPRRARSRAAARIGPKDRCLIVERNFLIRQDLVDMLQSLGIQNVDEAESVSQALECVSAIRYRLAFINVGYADKSSEPVADELKRQKIPFIVTTADLTTTDFPAAMSDAPVISKPYSLEAIRAILQRL